QKFPEIEKKQATYSDVLEREYRSVCIGNPKWFSTPYKAAKDVVDYPGTQFQQSPNTTWDKRKKSADIGLYTGYIFFNRNRITRNQLDYYAEMINVETTKSYKEFMSVDWKSKRPQDWVVQRIYRFEKIHDPDSVSGI